MSTSVVLFSGPDASFGSGLWVTNGTAAGTSELAHLPADTFFGFGSEVLFRAGGPYYGLGVTDGTASGTSEIFAGTGLFGVNPSGFIQLGSEVLFEGWASGWNLWVTNGTTAGTSELSVAGAGSLGLFTDNSPGGPFRIDPGFTVFGSKMLFSGIDAGNRDNLWVTDGTAAGTSELSVAGVSPSGLGAGNLFVFGSEVLFDGTDSSNRRGLWVTDGTAAGTSELSALGLGYPFVFGSEILFDGAGSSNHPGLWVTNGTAAGTSELSVNGAGSSGIFSVGFPTAAGPGFTQSGSEVLFAGVDASGKLNLWVTDGTGAGTSELSVAGAFSTGLNPKYLTAFGSEVVFAGTDTSGYFNLWITNGTTAGTSELATSSRGLFTDAFSSPFTVYGSEVVFQGLDPSGHLNLWVTDGTIAGTSELPIAGAVGPGKAYVLTFPPTTVTSVVAAPVNGVEGVGAAITITVGLSKAVTVTGGTPTLTLNDGGLAFYNAAATAALHDPTKLVFSYTVTASEHNVGALTVQDSSFNGATLVDANGNTPDLSGLPTAFPGLEVVTAPPATVTSVVASPASGVEGVGATITITVGLSKAVTVAGGTPTLTLNDGGLAFYDAAATAALGDPSKLVFSYTVTASEHNVGELTVQDGSLNGATAVDAAGNTPDFSGLTTAFPNLQVVATPPATVTSIVASPSSGVEGVGATLSITVALSKAVTVAGGTPSLALNDGGTATYDVAATAALGDPTKLVFDYTVKAADHDVSTLAVVGGGFNGATIVDALGNTPDFSGVLTSFPGLGIAVPPATVTSVVASPASGIEGVGQTITITVGLSRAVTVGSGTTDLLLNDGGTATYDAAATAALHDPTKLVFSYTVGKSDHDVSMLAVAGFNLPTVQDVGGSGPDFSGALTSFPSLQVVNVPVVTSVSTSPASGEVTAGSLVGIVLHTSAPTVAGAPELLLNDGGTAGYDPFLSTATDLFFVYRPGAEVTTDLKIAGIEWTTAPGNGIAANLSGAGVDLGLQVNTTNTGPAGENGGSITLGLQDLELFGPSTAAVTFGGGAGILKLDDSQSFAGTVAGFVSGPTNPNGGTIIDFADIPSGRNTSVAYTPNADNTGGMLSVSEGSLAAKITLLGNYSAASFVTHDDGTGHTAIQSLPFIGL
jgi:ELWxxDGT repeat protein